MPSRLATRSRVLVGHSYGGAVISNAAVGVPNAKALVYIVAFARDTGGKVQGVHVVACPDVPGLARHRSGSRRRTAGPLPVHRSALQHTGSAQPPHRRAGDSPGGMADREGVHPEDESTSAGGHRAASSLRSQHRPRPPLPAGCSRGAATSAWLAGRSWRGTTCERSGPGGAGHRDG